MSHQHKCVSFCLSPVMDIIPIVACGVSLLLSAAPHLLRTFFSPALVVSTLAESVCQVEALCWPPTKHSPRRPPRSPAVPGFPSAPRPRHPSRSQKDVLALSRSPTSASPYMRSACAFTPMSERQRLLPPCVRVEGRKYYHFLLNPFIMLLKMPSK